MQKLVNKELNNQGHTITPNCDDDEDQTLILPLPASI